MKDKTTKQNPISFDKAYWEVALANKEPADYTTSEAKFAKWFNITK